MRLWGQLALLPIDPCPNAGVAPLAQPIEWSNPRVVEIDIASLLSGNRSLESVMRSRRTSRVFSEAPIEEVAFVIRETLRVDFVGTGAKYGRKQKAVVSAGALHPIKGVLFAGRGNPILYDDVADQFLSVGVRDARQLDVFLDTCEGILPEARGHWIALIADCRDLSRLYFDHQSLLWRDAGAVIQTMALVAEARSLAFCPLGILGHSVISALLPNSSGFVAVGVAALGRP